MKRERKIVEIGEQKERELQHKQEEQKTRDDRKIEKWKKNH